MNLLDRQREHFNTVAEQYRTAREGANHLLLKHLIWNEALGGIDRFRGKKTRVLEALCGFADGRELPGKYLGTEIDYEGYDFSDEVVREMNEEHPDIKVWQADATTFVPEEEGYDIIVIVGGIHHVPDHAKQVVTNHARGLKKGGLFINFEPTFGNPVQRAVREGIYSRNEMFDDVTERSFAVGELFDMFTSAGLKPVKKLYPGLLSYILFYNPEAFPGLNLGGEYMVKAAFGIDRLFMSNFVGRTFSFATLSVWER
ncbi:MAG: hypothetical protein Rhirs2KO_19000 [Rhizobiaceae bacterium]